MTDLENIDVIIIVGSYAGLSANGFGPSLVKSFNYR